MDSLLSNAQRCARKADSLVKYGLYDEALDQLDNSIIFLNELKSSTTRYENIQMLNVQIDAIDRKKRSVAIKRSESIKKKTRVETLICRTKTDVENQPQREEKHLVDQSPILIDYVSGSNACNINLVNTNSSQPAFVSGSKLSKDEKSIIEELSTTNAEYKKVNTFLVNELLQLKKENDYLKVELVKLQMCDSLISTDENNTSGTSSNSSSSNAIICSGGSGDSVGSHLSPNLNEMRMRNYSSSCSSSSLSTCSSPSPMVCRTASTPLSGAVLQSKTLNYGVVTAMTQPSASANKSSSRTKTTSYSSDPIYLENDYSSGNLNLLNNLLNKKKCNNITTSGANSNKLNNLSQLNNKNTQQTSQQRYLCNGPIDLSKYINNDNEDDDDEDENYDFYDKEDNYYYNKENTDDESDLDRKNLPPLEFTIDS